MTQSKDTGPPLEPTASKLTAREIFERKVAENSRLNEVTPPVAHPVMIARQKIEAAFARRETRSKLEQPSWRAFVLGRGKSKRP